MSFRFHRASSYRTARGAASRMTLQRKCACGTHADGGECEECSRKHALQRRASAQGPEEVPSVVYDVLRGPGQPLDEASRGFMEQRFGHDFSRVRVHTGAQAERSAQAVNAEAYTVGSDIVFNNGTYAPSGEEGRRLLAHELAHVVQQDGAGREPGGRIAMSDSAAGESQADQAADAALGGAPAAAGPATGGGLQRKEGQAREEAGAAGATGAGPATAGPCIEEVAGEDIPSLLQAGAVTIIEFGTEWCAGCKQNKAGLLEICQNLRKQPPSVPVRMYSVDTDNEANAPAIKDYVDNKIPHLYIYVGSTQKVHVDSGLEFDALNAVVTEQIEYASTSGWWRGAKKGALWGLLPGGVAGLAGAIAIGAGAGGLSGNAQMGGILGALAGGAAAGMLLGGAIGAVAGAVGDDRNRGPRDQKRKKLQPKRHDGMQGDAQEREADRWADRAASASVPMRRGEPMEDGTRRWMETRFGRDFSDVRLHRDRPAQELTGSMNAHAVTSGADIFLASDAQAGNTQEGRALLGHELAHVAQNQAPSADAPVPALEREAAEAGAAIAAGRDAQVRHGSRQPRLALTRGEQTAAGAGIGAGSLGLVGALVGVGVAATMRDQPYGMGALVGGLIGAGVGAIAGGLIGFFSRRTSPETVPEAEMLIRRRFGRYLPGGVPEPLQAARVHATSESELCERKQCRSPGSDCTGLIGWTDTGPPVLPITGRMPAPLPTAAAEPTCHGQQMEHATPAQPVIYYVRNNRYAGVLLHEALHAHSHPDFAFLHNYVNEGVTEYFTRKLQDDINMPYVSGYDEQVARVTPMIEEVGEATVAAAYFRGEVPALHRAFNARHGRCSLITWAFAPEMNSFLLADDVMAGGPQNDYCTHGRLPISAAALTPGEAGYEPPSPPEQPAEGPRP
ncbi:DUF4157 domain-containing protein [Dyella sp. BiH032]|uniref:eCIS core domain-containing protein n=1 Tax=Dyella sp. BiH032 TaxID=3075430 RepID=UPI0028932020|nr:DUF4157 domain-containing protein [Dyella sp. BiH032]WNL45683.1 DUF4157 domain-containing protein [Dyella sp. BiH032]